MVLHRSLGGEIHYIFFFIGSRVEDSDEDNDVLSKCITMRKTDTICWPPGNGWRVIDSQCWVPFQCIVCPQALVKVTFRIQSFSSISSCREHKDPNLPKHQQSSDSIHSCTERVQRLIFRGGNNPQTTWSQGLQLFAGSFHL